ncbi:dolichyl-phosphate-mannose--protein O-mannosyl transferase [Trueperella bonasi]|uniref:Polyprenol-phosphate-mannose--protein mannosyltransferase n=1 Tax=Trueperella bonasi TaxID=312286 RepID=A0ABT9NFI4_9ACTO|nr:phospholipid carrier-dependent glycosyltransferase [Trueperella bonasi]MDP9806149.1 dolichyl-phosphate-mannose--protein O-mannosyl transferase [Trueperella bonasi]
MSSKTFLLSTGRSEHYENELRGRLGLFPKGATLPAQIRLKGWIITAIAALIAALTRFSRLTHPHAMVFDETYYVKGAFSLLNYGYERNWEGDDQNELFVAGDLSALQAEPDRWVHPPFGKWLMGEGMRIFGDDNGFGWRFTTALLGVLAVALVVRLALRLFHSLTLAAFAGIAMALDGMGIVLARTGLLDNILMFFVLAGFWAILRDREYSRAKLAHAVATSELKFNDDGALVPADPWAPRTGFRPWLLAAGAILGLACGVKWSGAYAVAVFGLFVFFWGAAARKAVGAKLWCGAGVWREGFPAFIQYVPVAFLGYLAAWIPWFTHPVGWDRQWAPEQQARNSGLPAAEQVPMPIDGAPDVVNSWLHYHLATMEFHTSLDSEHTYQSQPWAWLLQMRPVSFYWRNQDNLPDGACAADDCVAAITSVGNPFVWWLAAAALLVIIWAAIRHRDWRAWAILSGYIAMYLPWFMYLDRTIFQFYAIAFLPYVVLALTYGIGWLTGMVKVPHSGNSPALDEFAPTGSAIGTWGGIDIEVDIRVEAGAHELRPAVVDIRPPGKAAWALLGLITGFIVAAAIFWMPLWWGTPIPRGFWQTHMWMPSWI